MASIAKLLGILVVFAAGVAAMSPVKSKGRIDRAFAHFYEQNYTLVEVLAELKGNPALFNTTRTLSR